MAWEAPSASYSSFFRFFGVVSASDRPDCGLRAFRLWTFYAKCSATWAFELIASALTSVTH